MPCLIASRASGASSRTSLCTCSRSLDAAALRNASSLVSMSVMLLGEAASIAPPRTACSFQDDFSSAGL
eukprot:6200357-Pleurochrysis_carterae.AAC.3